MMRPPRLYGIETSRRVVERSRLSTMIDNCGQSATETLPDDALGATSVETMIIAIMGDELPR